MFKFENSFWASSKWKPKKWKKDSYEKIIWWQKCKNMLSSMMTEMQEYAEFSRVLSASKLVIDAFKKFIDTIFAQHKLILIISLIKWLTIIFKYP